MTLSETVITGLHNPECSFFVGMFIGQLLTIRIVIIFLIVLILWKFLDSLVINPLINLIKKVFKKKK